MSDSKKNKFLKVVEEQNLKCKMYESPFLMLQKHVKSLKLQSKYNDKNIEDIDQ